MKDAIGNELKVGDLVALQLERPLIYGRIVEIHQGGIITGMKHGQADMRPSTVLITSNYPLQVDPRAPMVGALICLREDEGEPPVTIEPKSEPQELTN